MKTNSRGLAIANLITNSTLFLLNNGNQTRQDINTNKTSAIDITCVSQNLISNTLWEVLDDNF